MTTAREHIVAAALVAGAIVVTYWYVIHGLVEAWSNDDNYSHGFFIVPLAAYFAWERRHRLAAMPARPSAVGLLIVIGSLVMLVAGILGAELFLSRLSLLGVIAGTILFLLPG